MDVSACWVQDYRSGSGNLFTRTLRFEINRLPAIQWLEGNISQAIF